MNIANQQKPVKIFEINNCLIDLNMEEIIHEDEVIKPETDVFHTLVYLIENRNHVVDMEEFRESLWHDAETSEFEIARNIMKARQAIQDDKRNPAIRYNPEAPGYQFTGDVFELEIN